MVLFCFVHTFLWSPFFDLPFGSIFVLTLLREALTLSRLPISPYVSHTSRVHPIAFVLLSLDLSYDLFTLSCDATQTQRCTAIYRPNLNRDRLPAVEPSSSGRNARSRNLGVELDLLDVLLVVLEQQLGRDVEVVALTGLVLVLLDGQVPEGDGSLGSSGGKDGRLGGVPVDRGDGGGVP